jgi:hypothetical protein
MSGAALTNRGEQVINIVIVNLGRVAGRGEMHSPQQESSQIGLTSMKDIATHAGATRRSKIEVRDLESIPGLAWLPDCPKIMVRLRDKLAEQAVRDNSAHNCECLARICHSIRENEAIRALKQAIYERLCSSLQRELVGQQSGARALQSSAILLTSYTYS